MRHPIWVSEQRIDLGAHQSEHNSYGRGVENTIRTPIPQSLPHLLPVRTLAHQFCDTSVPRWPSSGETGEKPAPSAPLTHHLDGTSILVDQLSAAKQSQTSAKSAADTNAIGFAGIEWLKDALVQMLRDARSTVFNAYANLSVIVLGNNAYFTARLPSQSLNRVPQDVTEQLGEICNHTYKLWQFRVKVQTSADVMLEEVIRLQEEDLLL